MTKKLFDRNVSAKLFKPTEIKIAVKLPKSAFLDVDNIIP